jgi:glycosyltransferase involved in cell wall biosynthesis
MRVLHVAAGNLYGGVERILVEIARVTGGARHEYALSFEGRLSRELDATGARRHALGEARFSRPLSTWRARRRLRAITHAGAYDAVLCHSPWAYALAAPALEPIRPILWAHDALDGRHWTERRVAARPPRVVICNSRYTQSAIGRWLPAVAREVVYAPVAAPLPVATRATVRTALGAGDDDVVIVVASRFERWKGHGELFRAAAGLDERSRLWIAGAAQRPHERQYESEVKALAAAGPLAARVRFLGERSDVADLFAAADIHCQPNSGPEPFGLAFVEALYASLPVVTSDAGGAPEIVTAECGVLVPMGDVEKLSTTLRELAGSRERRERLGAAGPARAREMCDPSRQLARLEAVLIASRTGVAA